MKPLNKMMYLDYKSFYIVKQEENVFLGTEV